jgi:2,3-diketo-5-methylthio-1-phosphopentane phosphatase
MAAVICLDFDDTVVLDNTANQIFERFAVPTWRDLHTDYHAGRLTVEQYNAAALDLVEASEDELRTFVRGVARPRAGLMELADWAHWHDWLVVVVSNGFDLYVDTVLDDLGLDRIARHAGRARFDYRWRVRYLSPRGVEVEDGFKLSYAAAFRGAGDFVVYVGDGASDLEAARLAAAVFARSTLWERLKDGHPRIYAFETFYDVVAVLDREAESWLASFLPQAGGSSSSRQGPS